MYYIPNMYAYPYPYPYSYDVNTGMNYYRSQPQPIYQAAIADSNLDTFRTHQGHGDTIKDYGANPLTININQAAKQNQSFRTALWTGSQFQITLMSLKPGEDIGLEMHPDVDQFLRIEQGQGLVQMGPTKERLNFRRRVLEDSAIVIPAGVWHNLTNTGSLPIKLYSIYAPPNHPFGTVHKTKAVAEAAEEGHHNHNPRLYDETNRNEF